MQRYHEKISGMLRWQILQIKENIQVIGYWMSHLFAFQMCWLSWWLIPVDICCLVLVASETDRLWFMNIQSVLVYIGIWCYGIIYQSNKSLWREKS